MSPLRPIARRALAAQSDERLVRLLREGHEPAFEEIVRRYRSPLVAFATAIVSHSRAEDVVQASLEKAHRALLADSREVALKPWLFTIVRNGALNTIRAEPRAEELVAATSTVPGPSELAEQREDLDRLVEAIIALPAAQRDALVKRELEGEGHGEIAAQLGTSATAVRGLIFRARTSLRDALGAVVPLPVLRLLLTEGPTVAGGAAAGGGVSAAVLGGAGAKGGTVIAAAIVALGTGIAVDHGSRSDQRQPGSDIAADVRAVGGGTAAADAAATGPSGALVDGSASGEGAATAGDYNGYDVEPASDFGPGRADDGGSESGSGGSGGSEDASGSGGSDGAHPPQNDAPSSGPGGGATGDQAPSAGGPGGGSSGTPGGGGSGSGDPGAGESVGGHPGPGGSGFTGSSGDGRPPLGSAGTSTIPASEGSGPSGDHAGTGASGSGEGLPRSGDSG